MENIWITLKPQLQKNGFKIDDEFLNKLSEKDVDYIKKMIYQLPLFILDLSSEMNDTKNLIVKKYLSKREVTKKFKVGTFINKGTYNQVYNIVDNDSNLPYVYRLPNFTFETHNNLVNNFIETFIHSFLTLYQKTYLLTKKSVLEENWGNNSILKIKHFGFNQKTSIISSITDKMDGTLYQALSIPTMSIGKKIEILVKALFQIICLIEHLQDKFKFVHNDLKANNIFFKIIDNKKIDLYHPNNLHFFISDFDASRIEIEGKTIIGNTHLSPDSSFNSRKDLFLLLHSLLYTFNSSEWMLNFFNKFNLDSSIIGNQTKFHELYMYKINVINDLFEPVKLKIFLEKEYSSLFEYWKILELSEDVIIGVYKAKYKIHYSK